MNTDYIQSEIDRYRLLIEDDKKKRDLIDQNIRYYNKQLKNAENAMKELKEGEIERFINDNYPAADENFQTNRKLLARKVNERFGVDNGEELITEYTT
jgi:galactokinase